MHLWFQIYLALAFASAFTQCTAESHPTPECNQLTYELIMKRITEVTHHTYATVKDAYIKTKRYVDAYKLQNDRKLNSIDMKLDELLTKLVAIQTQLVAIMTGPIALSSTDILEAAKATGVASFQMDDN